MTGIWDGIGIPVSVFCVSRCFSTADPPSKEFTKYLKGIIVQGSEDGKFQL
jgi:hypothetical protein